MLKWGLPILVLAAIGFAAWHFQLWMQAQTAWNKPEVFSNAWVAVGTIALALVTAWSVYRTNDVIRGEDRRHMTGFYPVVFATKVANVPGKAEWGLHLVNEGAAVAVSGTFTAEGEYKSDVWKQGNTALGTLDPQPLKVDGNFALVPLRRNSTDEGKPALAESPPAQYTKYILKRLILKYQDIFGNTYTTEYDDFHNKPDSFTWAPPERLKPKGNS